MHQTFQQTFTIPGTLAGNHTFSLVAPFDQQLAHVSLCNQSENAGTLEIGDDSDDNSHLEARNFGVSGTPAEVATFSGFDGVNALAQYPHINGGDTLVLTITDHASHMQDVCVVLTWTSG